MRSLSRRNLYIGLVLGAIVQLGWTVPAEAQLGRVKDALKKGAQEAQKSVGGEDQPKGAEAKPQTPAAAAGGAQIVFSAALIDPAKPVNLATSFKAGDSIYGLIQVDKTWRELLGRGDKGATKIEVPIDMLVDGKDVDFQYITIKKPEAIDGKVLVLDIAPEPDKMTAYRDPGFFYAEGKGNRKIGPDTYTYNLGELKPGKHTVRFQVRSYGDILSAGEFTIEGADYAFYKSLREKVLKAAFEVAGMPKAQKTDKELEATMRKLLENAGWSNVRKLVIVDKDWWLDHESDGESPIVSRHMDAAACAKANDGTYYYCICQFHQYKQIDGSFGPLELTHTGDKKPILEENIDK